VRTKKGVNEISLQVPESNHVPVIQKNEEWAPLLDASTVILIICFAPAYSVFSHNIREATPQNSPHFCCA
jgi:hypothetical protein